MVAARAATGVVLMALGVQLQEGVISVTHLLHDRDSKFCEVFDEVFMAEGVKVVRLPLRAPRSNAHAALDGSARRECQDWMLIVSQRHLEAVLGEYCAHYN